MSLPRNMAGHDPEPTYCRDCMETDLDGADFCPFCEEPTMLWADYCEERWEAQQEDLASGDSGPLPLEEQQRRAWSEKHGRMN